MADFNGDIEVKAISTAEVLPLLEAVTSNGSRTNVTGDLAFSGEIHVDNGNEIVTDEYRPQTQFILSGKGVTQFAINQFSMIIENHADPVRVSVQPPQGEPGQDSAIVVVYDDASAPDNDVITQPSSGHAYLDIEPLREGTTKLRISGGADNVHTWLTVTVTPAKEGSIEVSGGEHIAVQGQKPEDLTVSNRADVDVTPQLEAITSNGSQINLDTYRPQTQFILTGNRVEQTGTNQFKVYLLASVSHERIHVDPPPGEPGTGSSVVVVYDDDTFPDNDVIEHPSSGHPYFDLIPQKLGATKLRISGGEDNVHAWLDVIVVDEYPDRVFIKNGSQITIDPSIVVTNPYLLNNNYNNVTLDGTVILAPNGEDILVDNGSNVDAIQIHAIGVANGTRVAVDGMKVASVNERVRNGGAVNVSGYVILNTPDDVVVTNGSRTDIVAGHVIGVANGTRTDVYGWKEEPNTVVVVGGSNVEVAVASIEVNVPLIRNSTGSQVHVGGQKPEDIKISHHAHTFLFRGIQVERGNIYIDAGNNIVLTGVAVGGTMPDVSVPCLNFYQSLIPSKCFVKGQIEEIPEISLDSSIKLGVKLYSCSNTLLNPSTFTSAYFTFDDELQLPANIDTVTSSIYVVARPADLAVLKRKKIYDARLHVVDKQGNPSIVFTRKLRFV